MVRNPLLTWGRNPLPTLRKPTCQGCTAEGQQPSSLCLTSLSGSHCLSFCNQPCFPPTLHMLPEDTQSCFCLQALITWSPLSGLRFPSLLTSLPLPIDRLATRHLHQDMSPPCPVNRSHSPPLSSGEPQAYTSLSFLEPRSQPLQNGKNESTPLSKGCRGNEIRKDRKHLV